MARPGHAHLMGRRLGALGRGRRRHRDAFTDERYILDITFGLWLREYESWSVGRSWVLYKFGQAGCLSNCLRGVINPKIKNGNLEKLRRI